MRRTSVCQSDVVIHKVGLPRIKEWPAIILHEVSAEVDAVGEGVTKFAPGDLVGIGCDIPCGDRWSLDISGPILCPGWCDFRLQLPE
jgi:threonine dehydrogenase-like Zn-dependent dehydrogenase